MHICACEHASVRNTLRQLTQCKIAIFTQDHVLPDCEQFLFSLPEDNPNHNAHNHNQEDTSAGHTYNQVQIAGCQAATGQCLTESII